MEFTIKNNHTGRSYVECGNDCETLDMVWNSIKYWYSTGTSVTITDKNGNSKTFTK